MGLCLDLLQRRGGPKVWMVYLLYETLRKMMSEMTSVSSFVEIKMFGISGFFFRHILVSVARPIWLAVRRSEISDLQRADMLRNLHMATLAM